MHRRPLLAALTAGSLLLAAPLAHAATTSTYDGGANPRTLTLTNDADSESFSLDSASGYPSYSFTIKATNAVIPIPAGTTCTQQDGGKTLVCDQNQNIDRLIVKGGEGNDTFTLENQSYGTDFSGGISVDGEGGDDTFKAGPDGALNTYLTGGAGDDTFLGADKAYDYFRSEPGDDTYRGGNRPVPDGYDPDNYQQSQQRDSWSPGDGAGPVSVSLDNQRNDADGLGGTDDVGSDIEEIRGTDGDDTLTAGSAGAELSGQAGNDTLTGGPAVDVLFGDQGNDVLAGGGGNDTIYDGDYDPAVRLTTDPPRTAGDDKVDGGDGDDVLVVAAGKDDVVGGGGTDEILYARVDTQVLDAPPDYSTFATKWRGMTVSLDDQANDGPTGADEGDNVHSDIENVDTGETAGGYINDRSARISLQPPYTYAEPVIADDVVSGSGAANTIVTGSGNDRVDPGAGADTVDLGRGDDMVSAVDKVTDVIDCGRGTDAAGVDLAGTNAPRADSLTNCENVSGTALGLEGGSLPVLPTAPKVTLAGSPKVKVKAFLKTFTVSTDVTSDQDATAAGELSSTKAKLAKLGALPIGSGKLGSGTGTRTLKVKVAKKYRRSLKRKLRTKKQRKRGIKLGLVVTVTNSAGQATTADRTIRIKG